MTGRLEGKVAIVTGAGQTPGETIGNGRATAILFARQGARVLLVDRDLESAQGTQSQIEAEGNEAAAFESDVSREADCETIAAECLTRYGRIDILHNNVGIGAGDSSATRIDEATWQRILDVNLTSVLLMSKHVLPVMRQQGGGVITNVSSLASVAATPMVAYKVSKAGVNALTQQIAISNARHNIRCNAILPGLINTPMAVEGYSQARGVSREEISNERDQRVPLGRKMGTAWDVANAALFLASDEAKFITGVLLPVDGGMSLKVG
ncbi:MAG TPA: SDR family NAD(P)-dependent oxidoreductase [Dehalococcoidia bacterium]|nr:SDR family NAD(P)-dependent oxidoreductase [Dehalococcoidia bacterium]